MKISRNIIIDLLPNYLAGEASEETQLLIAEAIEEDENLASLIKTMKEIDLKDDDLQTMPRDRSMNTFVEIKRLLLWRTIGLALIFSFLFLCIFLASIVAYIFFTA